MSLAYLSPLFNNIALPDERASRWSTPELAASFRPVAVAALAHRSDIPILVIAPRQDFADRFSVALDVFVASHRRPLIWRSPDPLPYEQVPRDTNLSSQRIAILHRLISQNLEQPPIIVASARALMSFIRTADSFKRDTVSISIGDTIDDRRFVNHLVDLGYRFEPIVETPGSVARRGGIIDVYSPGMDGCVRIELFGDEIESLRRFDPGTQRSIEHIEQVTLLPPVEWDFSSSESGLNTVRSFQIDVLRPEIRDEWCELIDRLETGFVTGPLDLLARAFPGNSSTLLDFLPRNTLVVSLDPESSRLESEQIELRAEEIRQSLEGAAEIPAGIDRPYETWDGLSAGLRSFRQWNIGASADSEGEFVDTAASFKDPPIFAGRINDLLGGISANLDNGWRVIVATDQSERVRDILRDGDIYPRVTRRGGTSAVDPPQLGTVDVVHAPMERGFVLDDTKSIVLTDHELFGIRKTIYPPAQVREIKTKRTREFAPDSYVVHVEHGVGIFRGLTTLDVSGIRREYLRVDYADTDRLYVPVDQSDRLAPYEAPAGTPRITRLSSSDWVRTKSRVRQAVREMAYELLQIYAARELAIGHQYPPDSAWDTELAESFPYRETADQARAIVEVKTNLEAPQPMDRLVCGDVGYGKTEVALRAAFKVVNDGRQVAVLVPTTVLALQHFETFRERLAAFPVVVEMLSRLRSRGEQRAILEGLNRGSIDIVIGTHRILPRDVNFGNLGLLVVDEEQRFGVRHKEQIKRMRSNIDVLTMTATPIPRTLHMALTGLRDLSLITTPPQDRVPIRTFVTASDETVVREAILREMSRGGQVFFVHNRVQTISAVAARLSALVPEARIVVGHGQMVERELETVVLSFIRHEFDVLVCTTIIESGVDIPNTNTIIIDNAHALGLTQLYQLRGRVGRGTNRAYAYLLYPAQTPLSAVARERLAAIQEATELGAGFQIAMRDMEIRGAGNVLGAEQSGHIIAVGLDLYTRMLTTAVEEIRRGQPIVEPEEITLDIAIDARIPESYIDDESVRLSTYQQIASAENARQLREVRRDLIDRFGPVPDEVERIFDLVRLRHRAAELGITTIVERSDDIYIRPVVGSRLDQDALRDELGDGVRITPNQVRLRISSITTDRWTAITRVVSAVEEVRDALVLT